MFVFLFLEIMTKWIKMIHDHHDDVYFFKTICWFATKFDDDGWLLAQKLGLNCLENASRASRKWRFSICGSYSYYTKLNNDIPHVWEKPKVLKPNCFRVTTFPTWRNGWHFVVGLASFGPFSARQNGEDAKRFCEEIGGFQFLESQHCSCWPAKHCMWYVSQKFILVLTTRKRL